jgi:hypothetical protein
MGGIGGVIDRGVSIGLFFPLDLTLTAFAFPRAMTWAGSGFTTTLFWYVVAILSLPMVGAMLERAKEVRASSEYPENFESLKSLGIKKCWSWPGWGLERLDFEIEAAGMGGTGGARRSGDDSIDLLVTPGM